MKINELNCKIMIRIINHNDAMEYIECPVCSGNQNEDNIEDLKRICREAGQNGERCNSSGRQLKFSATGEKWLTIYNMCNSCDYIKIKEFLGK